MRSLDSVQKLGYRRFAGSPFWYSPISTLFLHLNLLAGDFQSVLVPFSIKAELT